MACKEDDKVIDNTKVHILPRICGDQRECGNL